MTKKYELFRYDYGVCRIKALRDIPRHGIKAGDPGGIIEDEHNLSQEGDCWVDKDSYVFNDSCVLSDAIVKNTTLMDNSQVTGCSIVNECLLYKNSVVRGQAEISNIVLHADSVIEGSVKLLFPVDWNLDLVTRAHLTKNEDFLIQGPALSSRRYNLAYRLNDSSVMVGTGCFYGTPDQFLQAIKKAHRHNPDHLAQYTQFYNNIVEYFHL